MSYDLGTYQAELRERQACGVLCSSEASQEHQGAHSLLSDWLSCTSAWRHFQIKRDLHHHLLGLLLQVRDTRNSMYSRANMLRCALFSGQVEETRTASL